MSRGLTERTIRRRGALCMTALVLAGALFSSAARAEDPPTSPDFDVVLVDLEGQFFNQVLPFDVPFILAGDVPAGASSLEVRCEEVSPKPKKERRPKSRRSPEGCQDDKPLVWSNTIDPNSPAAKFRLFVPRLAPETFYRFKFSTEKKVTPEEADAFAKQVMGVVDDFLWGDPSLTADLPQDGDIARTETPKLRAQLIDELKKITGADRIVEPGSLFNPDTPFSDARAQFLDGLRPAWSEQGQIKATIADYQNAVIGLVDAFTDLPSRLDKVTKALTARAASDPAFAPLAEDFATAAGIARPPVLTRTDHASAANLEAFVDRGRAYLASEGPKIATLRARLGGSQPAEAASIETLLGSLVSAGDLTSDEVSDLRALAEPRATVGRIDRALNPQGGAPESSLGSLFARFEGGLGRRRAAIATLAADFRTLVVRLAVIAGSTTGNFATQSRNYISADTGVMCAPGLDDCSTYVGTNIYFYPVNKAAPLNQFGPFFSRESLKRRLSLTLGLTVDGIGDDGKTREDLFNKQSLLLGLGARMSGSVRLTGGLVVFQELDPNPLVDDKTLGTSWFLSISFDIDVVKGTQGIFGLLGGT